MKQLFPTKGDSKFDKYFDKLYNGELIKDTSDRKGFLSLCILGNSYSRVGIGVRAASALS